MSVDTATVKRIASLARIAITDEDAARMAPELGNILGWIEMLGEVDTTGVEPMTAVIPNTLRLRDDVVNADPLTGGNIREQVLANAPVAEHGFFAVPKVIEANGRPAVKLSDNPAKATGEPAEIARYLRVFGEADRETAPVLV